ncbi:MAG: amidohydrolase family protein [Sedimentisphaerales bacterium]|nr:amidohydrolase family protein [Sedimentisphaerales bacterium]
MQYLMKYLIHLITQRFTLWASEFILMLTLLGIPCGASEPIHQAKPKIQKLGTIDIDLVETTPIVFKGKLYRFEYVRQRYWANKTGDSYFRFIDHETGQATPAFAKGYHLGSAFVDNDKVYVSCVSIWDAPNIELFTSSDLSTWEHRTIIERPGFGIFNTSICKTDQDYVLMYEIGKPPEFSGHRFTSLFARSKDMLNWQLLPPECNYAKDRYTAPHCLRYLDGWFYNFYLEAHEGYEMRVVRSKDFIHWEKSPLNPVLQFSEDDKKIANENFTAQQRGKIAQAKNINNSDIDFCEYQGRLIINYSWGNQHGVEFLAEAVFQGDQDTFLRSWFPEMTAHPAADLVITNAKIVTIDKEHPRAEAVAFKGEFIMAVGSNDTLEKYVQKGLSKKIDARGRLVVPGFNDAHIHFSDIDPDYIDLRYITDPKIITEKVKAAVANVRPGELIRGGRWEHEMFHNKQWPTKELIDPVAPNNPVVLSRADGHSVLVNSYVIRNSGITKDTPDPYGGEIQRDPVTGEPTGIFKERAQGLLKYGDKPVHRTPEEQQARRMRGWQAAFDMARKNGVTSMQLPPGGDFDIYHKFQDMDKLTARVYIGGPLTDDEEKLKRYAELQKRYPKDGNWIRFGYLKGFIDGTLGSGTALFFDPYIDAPDKTGLPMMPYEKLEQLVLNADKLGFQIGIHAIGDEGNHWVLNAYEKARQMNGDRDRRHRIEHAQVLHPDDIPRFAALGVVASMQPTHCITDKRFAEKRIGKERCKGAYAWQRLLDAGAAIAFGTDYPVEPIDPLEGLYAAVTRKDRAGEPGDGWFPTQKLSMEKAIELYTLGSAYAEFMEGRKGMIKVGYLGDVVIFNEDLMTLPHERIMSAKVDYTIVGGKVVYQRDEAQ